jgi:hypothetical protein
VSSLLAISTLSRHAEIADEDFGDGAIVNVVPADPPGRPGPDAARY